MKGKYDSKLTHELNEIVYNSGISIRIRNPHEITSEDDLQKLELLLRRYCREFGEEVVIGEWGQPFGGPLDSHRVHKLSQVKELQRAYKESNVNGIYPKLGTYYDLNWVDKKREHLGSKSTEFSLKQFFNEVVVGQI